MDGWIAIGLCVVGQLNTSGPQPGVPIATTAQAMRVFPRLSHNFGHVPVGQKCVVEFPIHNAHAVPVRVVKTQASCGCVVAVPAVRLIQPGQGSHLRVVMDTTGTSGEKEDAVYVLVDRPTPRYIVLKLKAMVCPDVRVSPGEIDMGRARRGAGATHTLDVRYTGSLDFRIGQVETALPYVTASAQQVARGVGRVHYRITTRLLPGAPLGLVQDGLRCTTNHPDVPTLMLTVRAQVETAFQVDPATLFFGFVPRGKTLRRTVRACGGRPFRIMRATGSTRRVSVVALPTAVANEHTLTVVLDARGVTGNLRDQMVLHLDVADHPPLKFTVYAHIRPH